MLEGWRESTVDIDLRLEPEADVFRDGNVDVHHFDPYSQALSKIERGFSHDLGDVDSMLEHQLIHRPRLRERMRRSSLSSTGTRQSIQRRFGAGSRDVVR